MAWCIITLFTLPDTERGKMTKNAINKIWTVTDVADRYNVSRQSVIRAIRTKKIRARKIGWVWVFRDRDLPRDWDSLPEKGAVK